MFLLIFQVLMGLPYGAIPRKTVPRADQDTAQDYSVLMDFNVSLIYDDINMPSPHWFQRRGYIFKGCMNICTTEDFSLLMKLCTRVLPCL